MEHCFVEHINCWVWTCFKDWFNQRPRPNFWLCSYWCHACPSDGNRWAVRNHIPLGYWLLWQLVCWRMTSSLLQTRVVRQGRRPDFFFSCLRLGVFLPEPLFMHNITDSSCLCTKQQAYFPRTAYDQQWCCCVFKWKERVCITFVMMSYDLHFCTFVRFLRLDRGMQAPASSNLSCSQ